MLLGSWGCAGSCRHRSRERRAIAEVIVCLAEVDRRRLFLREACSSLYTFCIERLDYSEDAARKRMRVARLYRELPQIIDELTSGSIHLTGLFLLSGHLTEDNAGPLLAEARGKTRREIELVIARWFPRPDVLPSITPLGADFAGPGTGASGSETGAPVTSQRVAAIQSANGATSERTDGVRSRVRPLSAQSYRVEFTASAELHAKLEHARNLLSHAVAPGNLGEIFERALDELIAKETKRRQGVVSDKPRKRRPLKEGSRHVPVSVVREVWNRDDHQCTPSGITKRVTFVDEHGRRCNERRYVTLEHVDPHARGGPPTAQNLCLLCKPHNQDAARREFGEEHMERKLQEARAHSKAAKALITSGFKRKQVSAALDALRKSPAEFEVEELPQRYAHTTDALIASSPPKANESRPAKPATSRRAPHSIASASWKIGRYTPMKHIATPTRATTKATTARARRLPILAPRSAAPATRPAEITASGSGSHGERTSSVRKGSSPPNSENIERYAGASSQGHASKKLTGNSTTTSPTQSRTVNSALSSLTVAASIGAQTSTADAPGTHACAWRALAPHHSARPAAARVYFEMRFAVMFSVYSTCTSPVVLQ